MSTATIWQALAAPYSAAGGIAFISADLTPTIDVNNLFWNASTKKLSVGTNGDFTGTDRVNVFDQVGVYTAQTDIVEGSGILPGFAAYSSRGTRAAPTNLAAADLVGQFAAFGYMNTTWQKMSGIRNKVAAAGTAGNLGGVLVFGTKADAGAYTDWIQLDSAGILAPVSSALVDLGSTSLLWKGVYAQRLLLDKTVSAVIGAVTINKAAGRCNIAAAASSVVVTNSLVDANSIIHATIATNDATAILKNVVAGSGIITITTTAAVTANTAVNFSIVG